MGDSGSVFVLFVAVSLLPCLERVAMMFVGVVAWWLSSFSAVPRLCVLPFFRCLLVCCPDCVFSCSRVCVLLFVDSVFDIFLLAV